MASIFASIVFLVILLIIVIGGVFLQIWLSKNESKWLGLILPIITSAFSLIAVAGMAAFTHTGPFVQHSQYMNGELVTTVISEGGGREVIPGAIGGVIYTFIIMNVPTVILLIIYKAVRGKKNRQRDVERMSLQDL